MANRILKLHEVEAFFGQVTAQSIIAAEQILQDFIDDKFDLEDEAVAKFGEFIDMYGTTIDANGVRQTTDLGDKAGLRYEALLTALDSSVVKMQNQSMPVLNAYQNQLVFNNYTFIIYQNMGIIPTGQSPYSMTPAEVSEQITSVKLNEQQESIFSSYFVDMIMHATNKQLFELVPPRTLARAYTAVKKEMDKGNPRPEVIKRFNTLASRIDYLIENSAKDIDFCIADPSNISDVHDGYNFMFDARLAVLDSVQNPTPVEQLYNENVRNNITASREKLEALIKEYDQTWNLDGLGEDKAQEINSRWDGITDLLKDSKISDDVLKICANYKFLDENGSVMPQFLDGQGNPQTDFQPGYTLDENGRLARIISLAKNDVTMKNVGDLNQQIEAAYVENEINEAIPWKMAEIDTVAKSFHLKDGEDDIVLDEQTVKDFWTDLETKESKITEADYQAVLDAQVNTVAGFTSRLAEKIGRDKDVLEKPFKAIEDIDALATTRMEIAGAENRKQKVSWFKRGLKNFGMGFAVSAGLTFLGKATGVAYIGAAIGTTLGVANMAYQGLKWRKEQKKLGKPAGVKEFFSDKRNWGPAVASGLGIGAVISMATGNPELALLFGGGAIATSTGTAVAANYADAIEAGYTKGQAFGIGLAVGLPTVLGVAAGGLAMNGIVNYVNENTQSNLFKTQSVIDTTTTETKEIQTVEYKSGVIENAERILNMWENPQQLEVRLDGLMDQGLSRDDALRYLLIFHDTTDHNLGNGYFKSIGLDSELLAAMRNSISGNDVNLTSESLAAFKHINPHISAFNEVGFIENAPTSNSLPANAMYGPDGTLIQGNDFYSTYVNHDGPFITNVSYQEIVIPGAETIYTPNELSTYIGAGTFGIYEPRVVKEGYFKRLANGVGSLLKRAKNILRKAPIKENDEEEKKSDEQEKSEKDSPIVQYDHGDRGVDNSPNGNNGNDGTTGDKSDDKSDTDEGFDKSDEPEKKNDEPEKSNDEQSNDNSENTNDDGDKSKSENVEPVFYSDHGDRGVDNSPNGNNGNDGTTGDKSDDKSDADEGFDKSDEPEKKNDEPEKSNDEQSNDNSENTNDEPENSNDEHSNDEQSNEEQTNEDPVVIHDDTGNSRKYGFFGAVKDVTYKIMQATKNGTRKIIKGVQDMAHDTAKQRLANQKEREELRSDLITASNKNKKLELMAKIDRDLATLKAQIKQASLKNDAKRLQELKNAEQKVSLVKKDIEKAEAVAKGAKDLKAEKRLEVDLKKIEDKYNRESKFLNAVNKVDISNEKKRKISWSARIRSAIDGLTKPNPASVEHAKIQAAIKKMNSDIELTKEEEALIKAHREQQQRS